MKYVLRIAVVVFAALLAFGYGVMGADAHHKPDHEDVPRNDAHPHAHDPGPSGVTEDNDADGFPNVPDPAGDTDNAHPSGRDRHADNGVSGHSESDPDGLENGGADKPGGAGGVDQLDQDGNNGCGNDDDFEDDNNGNCGGPDRSGPASAAVTVASSSSTSESSASSANSLGESVSVLSASVALALESAHVVEAVESETARAEVAAVPSSRAARVSGGGGEDRIGYIGELARTGFALSTFAALALAAAGAGVFLARRYPAPA